MPKEILTPEEKLKNLRKRFGLKQHEITDGQITRNLISMIENGKARLTHENGVKIVEKINRILQKRSIEIVVSPEEILETVEDQVEKLSVDYLEKFNRDPNSDLINEIREFIDNKKYSHIKFQLYKNIGDFYYRDSNFYKAIFYYAKIYDLAIKYETGDLLYELIFNYVDSLMKMMHFKDSIQIIKIIDPFSPNISKEQKLNLIKKKIDSLVVLNKYNEALKNLLKYNLSKELEDEFERIYSKYLEGFLYFKLENRSKAEKLFLKLQKNKDKKNIIAGKIGQVVINKEKYDKNKLKEILFSIEELIEKFDNINFMYFVYNHLGKLYLYIKDYSKAEFYFNKILKYEDKYFNTQMKYISVLNLIEIYYINNKVEDIFNLEKLAVDWVNKNYLKNNNIIFFKFIYIYSKQNLTDKVINLLEKINNNNSKYNLF